MVCGRYASAMNEAQDKVTRRFLRASPEQSERFERLLLDLTGTPTAAGREDRVAAAVQAWAAELSGRAGGGRAVVVRGDEYGNLVVERGSPTAVDERAPLFITAHMDHPAFVVEAVDGSEIRLTFRGGVLTPYFRDARIVLFTADDRPVRAMVTGTEEPDSDPEYPVEARFVRTCTAAVDEADATLAAGLAPGDVGRWDLPDAAIVEDERTGGRVLRAPACDDLAPLVAGLCAFELLLEREEAGHVRLLLTRAEEIGFVGAIAAARSGTMPKGSRAILLEASRSFAESPIGGGPIVRVGDRANTFSPGLTAGITRVGNEIAKEIGAEAGGKAYDRSKEGFRFQRKLMPGGVCESTAYLAYGYDSTCLCLPLGNYHNMADLTAVGDEKDETAIANARCGPEFVSVEDFHDLVTLLTGVGLNESDEEAVGEKLERLYRQRERVLRETVLFG